MILKDTNEIFARDLCDPTYAAGYVNVSLEEDGIEGLLYSLQKVSKACGMTKVAEGSGLNREALYRSYKPTGNPSVKSLLQLMAGLGMRLAVLPASIEHFELPSPAAVDRSEGQIGAVDSASANQASEVSSLVAELRNHVLALRTIEADMRTSQIERHQATETAIALRK